MKIELLVMSIAQLVLTTLLFIICVTGVVLYARNGQVFIAGVALFISFVLARVVLPTLLKEYNQSKNK